MVELCPFDPRDLRRGGASAPLNMAEVYVIVGLGLRHIPPLLQVNCLAMSTALSLVRAGAAGASRLSQVSADSLTQQQDRDQ